MAVKKSVSFNDYCWGEVQRAAKLWPEHADNLSGLVCKIIAEWGRSMSGGGKTERVISRIDSAEMRIITSIEAAKAAECDCVDEYDSNGMEK